MMRSKRIGILTESVVDAAVTNNSSVKEEFEAAVDKTSYFPMPKLRELVIEIYQALRARRKTE